VTRDRGWHTTRSGTAEVHRGGHRRLEPDAQGLQASVAAQADFAMSTADAVLLVVDATVGPTSTDEAVAKVLRRSEVPGTAGREQGRRPAQPGRRGQPVVTRSRRAVAGQRVARTWLR